MSKILSLSPRPDWALFLDIDGTLIDLAESPNDVIVPEGLPATLTRVSQAPGGADTGADGSTAARRRGGPAAPGGQDPAGGPGSAVPADVRLWLSSLPDRL